MNILIVGCGYLGLQVARSLLADGHRVFGTTRGSERAERLAAEGIEPIVADVLHRASLSALPIVENVVYCVGYDRKAGLPYRTVMVDGLRQALEHLADGARRFVFASSTGVYGDLGGARVDEQTPPAPETDSGRAILDAEQELRRCSKDSRMAVTILRFSGLYGPGRLPRESAIRAGTPIPANPAGYLNLVQIEDAASAVTSVLVSSRPGKLYLVSDDRPVARLEYYTRLAESINAPPPRFTEINGVESAQGGAGKRVSNLLIKSELGWVPSYPDITTGIPASIAP